MASDRKAVNFNISYSVLTAWKTCTTYVYALYFALTRIQFLVHFSSSYRPAKSFVEKKHLIFNINVSLFCLRTMKATWFKSFIPIIRFSTMRQNSSVFLFLWYRYSHFQDINWNIHFNFSRFLRTKRPINSCTGEEFCKIDGNDWNRRNCQQNVFQPGIFVIPTKCTMSQWRSLLWIKKSITINWPWSAHFAIQSGIKSQTEFDGGKKYDKSWTTERIRSSVGVLIINNETVFLYIDPQTEYWI